MKKLISVVRSTITAPLLWCAGLWALFVLAVLCLRPLITTIETRAMTVAWEMFTTKNFIVPTLNFIPYTQKPPLLAWLINLGWNIVGTHRFIATAIVSFFSFGCVALTAALAQSWWPKSTQRRHHAIWLCFGAAIFHLYGTVIFYDFILCFFVLAALFMLWQASLGKLHFFLWFGVCIGFGALTKGPVILVHVLPVALLAPVWITERKISWVRWYLSVIGAVIMGAVMALAWAIPAAVTGGENYGRWILLQQTTHRIFKAFDHEKPWWHYFAVTPILFIPWIFYPKVWQRLSVLRYFKSESPTRFLLCWIVSTFILFSLISGKQLHYILPLWAAFALLVARLLDHIEPGEKDFKITFVPFFLFSLVWLGLTVLIRFKLHQLPPFLGDFINGHFTLPFLYLAGISILFSVAYRHQVILPILCMCMVLTMLMAHIASPKGWDRFSTEGISQIIAQHPHGQLAVVSSRYQGDINYLLHLTQPVTVIPPDNHDQINAFLKTNPKSLVLIQVRSRDELKDYRILAIKPARAKRYYALISRK
ncbi:MAG TPA: hypothetical protein VGF14_05825 [Alphaproteobacteria bacterium]